jgi:hypothetical protein
MIGYQDMNTTQVKDSLLPGTFRIEQESEASYITSYGLLNSL